MYQIPGSFEHLWNKQRKRKRRKVEKKRGGEGVCDGMVQVMRTKYWGWLKQLGKLIFSSFVSQWRKYVCICFARFRYPLTD